ncbi:MULTISPECIES: biotin synthase BioB [Maricaulis]|jgi:biotin synthase|uniref:Biotin synthase n=1 Tax=Maricaulis maris (strain MCS10) TaxID=394221 RepID=BIOB_MARMM|nr:MULTISPECIES: biotin synthase BioB [Maricaulis]Q0ATN3.1 RecName: Full=Biotin synthase [Maricaulis maris MCS10]ABI64354.1 biotin synthase [Maricaulis maris MCS10]MAC89809.1 biotin synthase [Maricaulis sp.]
MSLLNDIDQLSQVRTDWTRETAGEIYRAPFNDLIFAAQSVHRQCHPANQVQTSQLLSIKTGGCAEDCGYCNQSAHFDTGLKASKLMPLDDVLDAAKKAKDGGATRFCMGAAWRELKTRDEDVICDMISGVKSMGMETCVTLGMLTDSQANKLREAGLDYYNHNLDTAPEDYGRVISTRTYQDRIDTLSRVRGAGIHVCTGGIVGMGEDEAARIGLLTELASMDPHPESVPINHLVAVPNTPLGDSKPLDGIEFVRTIATARILMPRSMVRLSAGREGMSRELQALCFLAGANSIFVGEELLTTPNPEQNEDFDLFKSLGIEPMRLGETGTVPAE